MRQRLVIAVVSIMVALMLVVVTMVGIHRLVLAVYGNYHKAKRDIIWLVKP